jgi:GH25 family lysozyme M1 (1,4-beta-N-acetylmuramidase)
VSWLFYFSAIFINLSKSIGIFKMPCFNRFMVYQYRRLYMKKCISLFTSLTLLTILFHPAYAMESRDNSNLKGIDVSHWDGTIDWSQVGTSGVKFAYLKASEGTTIVDSSFANDVAGARAQSIAVGAYHYARPTAPYKISEAVNQAAFFVKTMTSALTNNGDIMPVLDIEENGGLSPSELAQWIRVFSNTVELLTNKQVMLYVSEDFLQKNGDLNNRISDLPLWVAYWDQYYGGQNPPDIAGWDKWTAWQYSSEGTVAGITGSVDLDVGPSSLEGLRGDLTTTAAQDSAATNPFTTITLQLGSNKAIMDGKAQQLDVAPFTIQGRTMVPIRFITETLGAKVDWNPNTQEVTITMPNTTITLTIGQNMAKVNGKQVSFDVPAQLSHNRTFVPLRFISENLGLHIDYNSDIQAITISKE